MKINNFNQAISKLQPNLVPYLKSKGIETEKNFICINPKHKEKTGSMSVIRPEAVRVYCHGCGFTGDLFDVASIMEKKPVSGQAFITETLLALAEKFGVEIEHSEFTEEEIYELDTYRAYKYAAEFITNWPAKIPDDVSKEFIRRGWSTTDKSKLQELGVGFVTDSTEFRDYLKDIGFTAKFLDEVDLGRKDIFSPGHLIFTVKDEHGRPVGFSARDLNWVKGEGAKYINQKTTGVKCNIYQKGKRLYNLDVALRASGPIYIFEGQTDVISANLKGITNCVAACGTSFTADHLSLLKENNRFDIILCLDGDTAGQERTAELLDKRFGGHRDINLRVINLGDGLDPDEFLRTHSVEEFNNLKKWTAFEWRLSRFPDEAEPSEVASLMMPLIVNESSHIKQDVMLDTLARHTGLNLKSLTSELSRLLNEKERDKDQERRTVLEKLARDMVRSPEDAEVLITEAQVKLQVVRSKYEEDNLSEDATFEIIKNFKMKEESKDGKFQGFVLGEDLMDLQQALSGEWKKDVFMVIGGKANSGKTSFMSKLAFEIASHEKENNACVIYLSIDDTTEQLLPKFICIAEGTTNLEINHVKDPVYFKKNGNHEVEHMREDGYKHVLDLVKRGRLVIKDANDGSSLAFLENLVKYYQAKYPDRQVVAFLDNFHKLRDIQTAGDERVRFKTISTLCKDMVTRLHIPMICTMEYTKLPAGTRPTNDNIAETVQMEYDTNFIAHMFNGLHEFGDVKADQSHYHVKVDAEGNLRKLPIIEMNIGKNKISSFKSRLFYQFYPASSDFKQMPAEMIEAAQEEVRKTSMKQELPSLFKRVK